MDELSPVQVQAIIALLATPTLKQAAEQAGVAYETLYHWLHRDEAFQGAYRQARRQAVEAAVATLQQDAHKASGYLVTLVEDAGATNRERLSAAKSILELAIEGISLMDLEGRIAALEARAAE